MMNRKIMMAPWSVNTRLYVSALMMVRPGVRSSMRISIANIPPSRNANRMEARYMTPMRLWSTVVSQDLRPRGVLR
jgi:hypothetical protein